MGKKRSRSDAAPSRLQLEHVQNVVNKVVPSEPWYEHCMAAIHGGRVKQKPDPQGFVKEMRRQGVFPPGPSRNSPSPVLTPMRPCRGRPCRGREKLARLFPFYFRQKGLRTREGKFIPLCEECWLSIEQARRSREERPGLDARDRRRILACLADAGPLPLFEIAARAGVSVRLAGRLVGAAADSLERFGLAKRTGETIVKEGVAYGFDVFQITSKGCTWLDDANELEEQDAAAAAEPPSPAQAVQEEMMFYGTAPRKRRLASEDKAVLQQQIDRYLAGQKTTVIVINAGPDSLPPPSNFERSV